MGSTQTMVTPLGLWNRPNQYGKIEPGAMFDAADYFMRRPGVLEVQPSPVLYSAALGTSAAHYYGLMSTDVPGQTNQYVIALETNFSTIGQVVWYLKDGTAPNGLETWSDWFYGSNPDLMFNRPFYVHARSRLCHITNFGLYVWDYLNPTSAAQRKSREAGLNTPSNLFPQAGVTGLATFPNGSKVRYRVTSRLLFADGYEVVSMPSGPALCINDTGTTGDFSYIVRIPSQPNALPSGHQLFVDVWRTRSQPSADPGATYYLAKTILVTAGNANTFVTVDDSTPDNALGDELYTNAGQEGEPQANRKPPLAKTIASYKGFAFYGNLVQPATVNALTVQCFNATGSTPVTGAAIGVKAGDHGSYSGTTTNGSPTITAVSPNPVGTLQIGMFINAGANGLQGGFVTALTSTTITSDRNATSSGSFANWSFADTIAVRVGDSGGWFITDVRTTSGVLSALSLATSVVGANVDDTVFTVTTGVVTNHYYDGNVIEMMTTVPNATNPLLQQITAFPIPTTSNTAAIVGRQDIQPNGLQWSKDSQPEYCPGDNIVRVGNGTILKLESTRDALWIFCSDGIYRLSGAGGDWSIDPVDSTITITGPQATCVMRDIVYAYTNIGLVRITSDNGIEAVSKFRLNELQGSPFAEEQQLMMTYDEKWNEVWFCFSPNTANATWYVYNADTDAFTTSTRDGSFSTYSAVHCKLGFNGGLGGIEWGVAGATQNALVHIPQAGATSWKTPLANFMPLTGKSPSSMKQWQRCTHIFETGATVSVIPLWNELDRGSIAVPRSNGSTDVDARAAFWVPRQAAIAPAIKVGWTTATAPTAENPYLGFKIEMEELTDQPRAR